MVIFGAGTGGLSDPIVWRTEALELELFSTNIDVTDHRSPAWPNGEG